MCARACLYVRARASAPGPLWLRVFLYASCLCLRARVRSPAPHDRLCMCSRYVCECGCVCVHVCVFVCARACVRPQAPMIDSRCSGASYDENGDGTFFLNTSLMQWFWFSLYHLQLFSHGCFHVAVDLAHAHHTMLQVAVNPAHTHHTTHTGSATLGVRTQGSFAATPRPTRAWRT